MTSPTKAQAEKLKKKAPRPSANGSHSGTPAATPKLYDPAAGPAAPLPLPLVYFDQIEPALAAADFVEELLIDGTMSVVYGESNTGKTFWALDLALHVADGREWRGRAVERGAVLYLALEGSHGISNRVAAFKVANPDVGALPFAVVPVAVNLLNPAADTTRVIDAVQATAVKLGVPVRLIVVDTLSRALAGGNENASEDMGSLVTNADRIRQVSAAHLMFIHHSGKDSAKGARGHSSLRAATDTEIEAVRDPATHVSVARVSKQRDLETVGEFAFRLQPVELGVNRRGKPVTSCVVVPEDAPERTVRLPGDQQTAMNLLMELLGEGGLSDFPGVPTGVRSAPIEYWRDRFYQRAKPVASQDAKRQAFNRAINGLSAAGLVAASADRVWIVTKRDIP